MLSPLAQIASGVRWEQYIFHGTQASRTSCFGCIVKSSRYSPRQESILNRRVRRKAEVDPLDVTGEVHFRLFALVGRTTRQVKGTFNHWEEHERDFGGWLVYEGSFTPLSGDVVTPWYAPKLDFALERADRQWEDGRHIGGRHMWESDSSNWHHVKLRSGVIQEPRI